MSWPVASFAIVALILAAGWVTYEWRRPSARMAAVVAVMAALAALGRDAFAALPDVKPITAMTLVVGYALGPLPGFAVGALGMLASNFALGQGPYTPWQMAAWGMVGLFGALLGGLSRRRLGRLSLACACALAALAAKELMNVYTWTLGAAHTPAAFLLVAGQALPFDVTDVVSSFAFGLLFALELARILERTRLRMNVEWIDDEIGEAKPLAGGGAAAQASPPAVASVAAAACAETSLPGRARARARGRRALAVACGLALVAVAAVGGVLASRSGSGSGTPPAVAAPAARRAAPSAVSARVAIAREVAYLAAAQDADGGFGAAPGQSSSELYTAWVALGLAAAGRDPLSVRRDGHTLLDALRAEADTLQGAGDFERTILALRACGVSTRSLPGVPGGDPVAALLRYRQADGSFEGLSNLTAFAVLALRAAGYRAGSPVLSSAAVWLERQQEANGGFGFAGRGGGADVDDTAAVVQALAAAGEPRRGGALGRAAAYLVRAQNLDGGFPQQPGGQSNAQSTAWAVQALAALARNPAGVTRDGSRSPLGYLIGLVAPDGSVRYSATGAQTPVWVTAQALTALALKPMPIAPVAKR